MAQDETLGRDQDYRRLLCYSRVADDSGTVSVCSAIGLDKDSCVCAGTILLIHEMHNKSISMHSDKRCIMCAGILNLANICPFSVYIGTSHVIHRGHVPHASLACQGQRADVQNGESARDLATGR